MPKRTIDQVISDDEEEYCGTRSKASVRKLSVVFRRIPLELWLMICEYCLTYHHNHPLRPCDGYFQNVRTDNEVNWFNVSKLLSLLWLTGCPTGFMNDLVREIVRAKKFSANHVTQYIHNSFCDLSPATQAHYLMTQTERPWPDRELCRRCLRVTTRSMNLSRNFLPNAWLYFLPDRDKHLCPICFYNVYYKRLSSCKQLKNTKQGTRLFSMWYIKGNNKDALQSIYGKDLIDHLALSALDHKRPTWTYMGKKYVLMFDYKCTGRLGAGYCVEPLPDILMYTDLTVANRLMCNNLR